MLLNTSKFRIWASTTGLTVKSAIEKQWQIQNFKLMGAVHPESQDEGGPVLKISSLGRAGLNLALK